MVVVVVRATSGGVQTGETDEKWNAIVRCAATAAGEGVDAG